MIREVERKAQNGLVMLGLWLLVGALLVWQFVATAADRAAFGGGGMRVTMIVIFALLFLGDILMLAGLFTVNPNEGKVLQLFGKYVGTVREEGLQWANPFYTKHRVSLRVRNFETGKIKVNDKRGNPIEFAAVVVWKVVDTAEAVFMVDDFEHYVHVQSEAAGRNLATAYPYDVFADGEVSLVSHTAEISEKLQVEIQDRLDKAGVQVIEARISHLAYAPEIASAMLQRQQADAVIAARYKIVEGAVGMVENALELLGEQELVDLDNERKAAMISNLLVVLCGDSRPQPVLNAGSIYQ
jgi:regulator of protease activity HflC (stomatin/prohibitin superfamily)